MEGEQPYGTEPHVVDQRLSDMQAAPMAVDDAVFDVVGVHAAEWGHCNEEMHRSVPSSRAKMTDLVRYRLSGIDAAAMLQSVVPFRLRYEPHFGAADRSLAEVEDDFVAEFLDVARAGVVAAPAGNKEGIGDDDADLTTVEPLHSLLRNVEIHASHNRNFLPVKLSPWEEDICLGLPGSSSCQRRPLISFRDGIERDMHVNLDVLSSSLWSTFLRDLDVLSLPGGGATRLPALFFDLNDQFLGLDAGDMQRLQSFYKQFSSSSNFSASKRSLMISKDESYRNDDEADVGEEFSAQVSPLVKHPPFVVRVEPPFFPRVLTEAYLQHVHRPRLNWLLNAPHAFLTKLPASAKPLVKPRPVPQSIRHYKLEHATAQNGRVVLVEYSEEKPPLLSLPGMAARVRSFYCPTGPEDTAPPGPPADGFMEAVQKSEQLPFLSTVAPGQTVSCLETNMSFSEIIPEPVRCQDFLVVVPADGSRRAIVREIDSIFVAGHQQARAYDVIRAPFSGPVPMPTPKNEKQMDRERLLNLEYRLLQKVTRDDEGRPVRRADFNDVLEKMHDIDPRDVRRIAGEDCDLRYMIMRWKAEREFPTEQKIQENLNPEKYSRYVSMKLGTSLLEEHKLDREVWDITVLKALAKAQESRLEREDIRTMAAVEQELKTAPWISTETFISAASEEGDSKNDVTFADIHFIKRQDISDALRRFSEVTEIRQQFALNHLVSMGMPRSDVMAMTPADRVRLLRQKIAAGYRFNVRTAAYRAAVKETLRQVLAKECRQLSLSKEFPPEATVDAWFVDAGAEAAGAAGGRSGPTAEEIEANLDEYDDLANFLDEGELEEGGVEAEEREDAMSTVSEGRSSQAATSRPGGTDVSPGATAASKAPQRILRRHETYVDDEGNTQMKTTEITDPEQIKKILKQQETLTILRQILRESEAGVLQRTAVREQVRDRRRKEKAKRKQEKEELRKLQKTKTVKRCPACGQVGHIKSNRICPMHPEYDKKKADQAKLKADRRAARLRKEAEALAEGRPIDRKISRRGKGRKRAASGDESEGFYGQGDDFEDEGSRTDRGADRTYHPGMKQRRSAASSTLRKRGGAGLSGSVAQRPRSSARGYVRSSLSHASGTSKSAVRVDSSNTKVSFRLAGSEVEGVVGRAGSRGKPKITRVRSSESDLDESFEDNLYHSYLGGSHGSGGSKRTDRSIGARFSNVLVPFLKSVIAEIRPAREQDEPSPLLRFNIFIRHPHSTLQSSAELSTYKKMVKHPVFLEQMLKHAESKSRYISTTQFLKDLNAIADNSIRFCAAVPEYSEFVSWGATFRSWVMTRFSEIDDKLREIEEQEEQRIASLAPPAKRSRSVSGGAPTTPAPDTGLSEGGLAAGVFPAAVPELVTPASALPPAETPFDE